jgi:hypothetical protein
MSPTGLNVNQKLSAPASTGTRKATADIMLTRATSVEGKLLRVCIKLVELDILKLLFAPALKLVQQVFERETHRTGFFEEPIDQFRQVVFVFVAMTRGEMAGADKRSHASSGFEDSGAFQLGVNLGHRVGIDA